MAEQPKNTKYCINCGAEIDIKAEICPKCGVRQPSSISGGRSRIVASLLAIFLGGLGIHKFYLGNWIGIIYLLFCWTFIPAIVGFIEGIMYLMMSDKEFAAKYG